MLLLKWLDPCLNIFSLLVIQLFLRKIETNPTKFNNSLTYRKHLSDSAGKWVNWKTKHDKFSSNFFCFKRSLFLFELHVENIKMLWFHNSFSPNLHAWCVLWYWLNIIHWSGYIFQKYIACERLLLILKRTCALNFCIRVFNTQIHRSLLVALTVLRTLLFEEGYMLIIISY